MAKAKEIKVNFYQNVNECWTGTALLKCNRTGKTYKISYSMAPGTRANSARPIIRDELKKMCTEFITEHPTYVRVELE